MYLGVRLCGCQLCLKILACLSAGIKEQHARPHPTPPTPPPCTFRMLNMAAMAASELLDCVSWGMGKLSPGSS